MDLSMSQPSVQRVVYQHLLARTNRPESMGAWGGKEHQWPDPGRDWDLSDGKWDRSKDAYEVEYQWTGGQLLAEIYLNPPQGWVNLPSPCPGRLPISLR